MFIFGLITWHKYMSFLFLIHNKSKYILLLDHIHKNNTQATKQTSWFKMTHLALHLPLFGFDIISDVWTYKAVWLKNAVNLNHILSSIWLTLEYFDNLYL